MRMKEERVSVETKTGPAVFLEMRSSETEVALSEALVLVSLSPSSSAIADDEVAVFYHVKNTKKKTKTKEGNERERIIID